jgi:hypothetical protein
MNNTSKLFSLTYERFLYYIVLEQTKSDLLKITVFVTPFNFIQIVLMLWDMFILCYTLIRSFLAFHDQILILIVGCVTIISHSYSLSKTSP